MLSGTVPSQE